METVSKLVNQLSVDDKQRENRRNQSRERSGSRGRWVDERRDRGQQQDRGFNDRRRFPTPRSSHRDRLFGKEEPSRRNDRQGFKCRACGQEEHFLRNCRNCFLCGGSQHLKRNCPFKKKITENCNVIRVCSTNTLKCLNTEIILHGNRCVGLIDSGSSISRLSWSTYEKLGKPGIVQTYTKRVLTANNSVVKIIGRVTLLVQLQPRLPEVEQEFVITADEGIEFLLGVDFLKTNKCVLNLHEEKLYSSHFNISMPLTKEKTQGVHKCFCNRGQNTYIQSKNESLMKIRLADENGEEIPGMEGLVEAIEDFELKTGLLLATCMISMKDGWNLIKVLNLTDAPVTAVYKSTKLGTYSENKENLISEGIFTSQNKPKTLEFFQIGKHANLEGSKLNGQQKEKVQDLFTRHQQVFSRNSNDLGHFDKIKHQIKLNKHAQPFSKSYCSMSFDKRKAMKKIVEDLEDAKLTEPTHSYWAAPSILVKKKDGSYRLIVDYRDLNKQIEKTSWPLPRKKIDGNGCLSIIDLTSRYFQMALEEESQNVTAFVTPMGLYKPTNNKRIESCIRTSRLSQKIQTRFRNYSRAAL